MSFTDPSGFAASTECERSVSCSYIEFKGGSGSAGGESPTINADTHQFDVTFKFSDGSTKTFTNVKNFDQLGDAVVAAINNTIQLAGDSMAQVTINLVEGAVSYDFYGVGAEASAQQEQHQRNAENDAYFKDAGLYGRDDLTLVEIQDAGEFGLKKASEGETAFHRKGPGNGDNFKYTSKVAIKESWYQKNFSNRYGRYELIVRPNANGTFTHVTDPVNMGTLNRGNNPFTHITRDVVPYLRFGNVPN